MNVFITCIYFFFFVLKWGYPFDENSNDTLKDISIVNKNDENISSNNLRTNENDLEPSVEENDNFDKIHKDNVEFVNQQFIVETTSLNSALTNEITVDQPVPVTLTDASNELEERAKLSNSNKEIQHQTQIIKNQTINKENSILDNNDNSNNNNNNETKNNEKVIEQTEKNLLVNSESAKDRNNLTEEEIPSFSEWTQKRLEAEKHKEIINFNSTVQNSSNNNNSGINKQYSHIKLRWKNYGSLDCGAKIVANNPEAVSPGAVLSPSKDEYQLNPCTSRTWFIVELCEAIQAKKIELANFELFSSSPKDFIVGISNRFPTRDWSIVGQFTAKDERDIQTFELNPYLFGKYIKIEIKSHYGAEHYCPISLLRVYGTSEFEALQKEDTVHDDEEDSDEELDLNTGDLSKNLFSSATDAVISIVKKAAQVLGNNNNETDIKKVNINEEIKLSLIQHCSTPSHLIICDNCSNDTFEDIYNLLSCNYRVINDIISTYFIRNTLLKSHICQQFGFIFIRNLDISKYVESLFLKALFQDNFLGALCNVLATNENKVTLNITYDAHNKSFNDNKIFQIKSDKETNTNKKNSNSFIKVNLSDSLIKSTCSTDINYVTQIIPTRTSSDNIKSVDSSIETTSKLDIVTPTETLLQTDQTPKTTSDALSNEQHNTSENLHENESNENLEHLMSELVESPQNNNIPQPQKESVFLRLSNRIKALERNMSLSSQYLEELSKRYKKQVEEMQKFFDKSLLALNEENKMKNEQIKNLEILIINLNKSVDNLITEKNNWFSYLTFIVIIVLVNLFFISFCLKSSLYIKTVKNDNGDTNNKKEIIVKRRKSIDIIRPSNIDKSKKKRRSSDQTMKYIHHSSLPDDYKEKKKRRKNSQQHQYQKDEQFNLKRSNSLTFIPKENSIGIITDGDDVLKGYSSFVLEESDHTTLDPMNFQDTIKQNKILQQNGKNFTTDIVESLSSNASPNNSISSKNIEIVLPIKKEKKGFKKIFRKVF